MIEIIPNLLTPAMLAMSPPAVPAPEHNYDWQSQRTEVRVEGKLVPPDNVGTIQGTNSYVGGHLVVDDAYQD